MRTYFPIGILFMLTCTAASAKDVATFYTPDRIAAGRRNLERYDWARKQLGRILAGDTVRYYVGPKYGPAGKLAEKSDAFMWLLQPTTKIPRFVPRSLRARCPKHGTKVRDKNPWCPYRIDPINKPYKVQCMLGGEWYPSNNFAAGDLTSGEFPDDGEGIHYQGETYYLLWEYAHMVYGSFVVPSLRSLSQAYVLTGDTRYARKGTILLARLASEYPNYEDHRDRLFYARQKGFRDPDHSWKAGGMITDLIWETFCLEAEVLAYDAFFPYMTEDTEMIAFLQKKGMPVQNGQDLRHYIEKRLIRVGMQALLKGDIHGNEGFHQAAAMACALVLDDYGGPSPNSKDMVDYTFHGIGHASFMLTNGLTRDGGGHESPNYNRIKLDFIRVNRLMALVRERQPQLFSESEYPDLFAGPKARRIFDYFIDCNIQGLNLPSVGDCGGIRDKPIRIEPKQYSILKSENLFAFERYGDPLYARACTRPDGGIFSGELFEPYPEKELEAALARPESRILPSSRLLDGYGLAILASGQYPNHRAVMLNYTSLIGHRQFDNLSMEFFARGVELMPDLGYPATWKYRWQWDSNSMAHNTVTVDETQPGRGIGGMARLFASQGGVHVISASHDPYPPGQVALGRPGAPDCTLYERTMILVDVDDVGSYVIDAFAVNGGEQHDQSWHGPLVPVTDPGLDWKQQEKGTLAGPSVPQFSKWTDRWDRPRDDFPAFLVDIKRAPLDRPAAWDWPTGLPEGDTLRLHFVPVGEGMEVIRGRGRSPARPENWWLPFVLARRIEKDGAASLFLSVIEAFQKKPVIRKLRLVSNSPLILEVERDDGMDTITLNIPLTASRGTEHRALGIRVQSVTGGQTVRDVEIGNPDPHEGPGYATTRITALDYANDRIAVPYVPGLEKDFVPGRAVRIFNSNRNALYRVHDSERKDEEFWITLDATALLAKGKVIGAGDGWLRLDAYLVFANGREDKAGGLAPGRYYYAGGWLGEGESARQVKGALRSEKSQVYLTQPVPAGALEREYLGKIVTLWQYGLGDRVELARTSSR